MNRIGTALLCALLIVASHSLATDFRKLSGYVKQFVDAQRQQPALARGSQPSTEPTLTAFVKADAAMSAEVFSTYGCRRHAQYGDLSIVSIPTSRIAALSDHPAVRRIEASPTGRLTMDTTSVIVGASRLYTPVASQQLPLTGEGVVVGVMDVGFDLTHPNFYDASATRYRIGAFWDQLSKDTVGSALPVGRDFVTTADILAQQHSVDGLQQTHGTHTLGIAAGSGYRSPYRGVAYDADLCLVSNAISDDIALIDSADLSKYTSAIDALGFKYIFDYADRQHKPCVASFSEGYQPYLDEEDSLYAAFLDSLTATPGHIIVVSAGNEGLKPTYLEKPAGMAEAGAFIGATEKKAFHKIKTDGPLALMLYAYREGHDTPSDTLAIRSTDARLDSLLADTLMLAGDTCIVHVERYPAAMTPDTIYMLRLTTSFNLSAIPIALVVASADSRVEVYGSSSSPFTTNAIDTRWNGATTGHNILAPGNFASVICVGATAHRLGFVNYKGEYMKYAEGRTVGLRSPYSSVGPTMDGLMKPDVMAPGDNVISSYSSYYIEANPDARDINSDVEHFDFQGRTYAWNANTGTSMSAPVVAGVIAQWLQAKPDLTRDEVMRALRLTCRQPDATLTYPNHAYGYGEIDAYRGLLSLLDVDAIADVSTRQPSGLHVSAASGQLFFHVDGEIRSALRVRVYRLDGTVAYDATLTQDTRSLPLPLSQGLYIVQTDSADRQLTGSQLIRIQP